MACACARAVGSVRLRAGGRCRGSVRRALRARARARAHGLVGRRAWGRPVAARASSRRGAPSAAACTRASGLGRRGVRARVGSVGGMRGSGLGLGCSGARARGGGESCSARGEGERGVVPGCARQREREKEGKERKGREIGKRKKKRRGERKRGRERESRRNRRPVGHARCLGARERDARVEGETGQRIWLSGLGPTGIGRSGGKRRVS